MCTVTNKRLVSSSASMRLAWVHPCLERVHRCHLDALRRLRLGNLAGLAISTAHAGTPGGASASQPAAPHQQVDNSLIPCRRLGLRLAGAGRARRLPSPLLLPLQLRQAALQQGAHEGHLRAEEADDAHPPQRHARGRQLLHSRHNRLGLGGVAGAAACRRAGSGGWKGGLYVYVCIYGAGCAGRAGHGGARQLQAVPAGDDCAC